MNIAHLIFREISHRKLNFILSVSAVTVAALAIVLTDWLLRKDTLVTRQIMAAKQAETETAIEEKVRQVAAAGADLEDSIRKQMLGLGFNVLILPANQDVSELHLQGSLSETMPESYAEKLANSKIITVNHLLPTVMKQVKWPEQELDVILYGTRGEVPLMHRDMKKPLLDAVAPGQMVLGHSVHQKLKLQVGDKVKFHGRDFTISKLHPERGSTDDVTVWIDLAQAQEILELQNLVHGILALECECAGDRIAQIRAEISGILPGTQVIERYSQALARAEARSKAKEVAEESLAAERTAGEQTLARELASRQQLQEKHQQLAQLLVPVVLLVAAAAVGLLAYTNVRYRREEIGILRALGLRTGQIMRIFLGKALFTGLLGGILGICLAVALGVWLAGTFQESSGFELSRSILTSPGFIITLGVTPLLAVVLATLSSWLAATVAAKQDAALILQGE